MRDTVKRPFGSAVPLTKAGVDALMRRLYGSRWEAFLKTNPQTRAKFRGPAVAETATNQKESER